MWIPLLVIFLFYALLIFFYWRHWEKAPEESITSETDRRFISVLVPARNEKKSIVKLLSALSEQSYPIDYFEVIVVDDYSTDNTSQIVKGYQLNNLTIIQPDVSASASSKKKAIEAGIRIAKGELIVTTDADCVPQNQWLQSINAMYVRKEANFIAAPVKFSHNNSLLQIFQALDFMTLQGITAASVSSGFHTMCNGANLSYQKRSFEEVKGFEGIDKVATGDDMLLMYKIWKKNPAKVFYLKSKEAIVTTEPMLTWSEFFMQRKRWASKTLVYKDYRIIIVLAFIYVFNCIFFGLIIAALFNSFYWWYVLGYWVIKNLVELPFVYSVAKFYGEKKLMRWFFFFQPLHIFYTVVVGALSQFGKYEWKGRKTK